MWTNEEIEFVKNNYKTLKWEEIANYLGYHVDYVRKYAKIKLNIKKHNKRDLPKIGERFLKFEVISEPFKIIKRINNKNVNITFVKVRCKCGTISDIRPGCLYCANQIGCKKCRRYTGPKKTHGLSNSRIYSIYCKMKDRCLNKNIRQYKNYGGRGITICNEWLDIDGFVKFYNWSMNNGYEDDLSIDRINNDLGYNPNNCRWTTTTRQANNTRTNKYILAFGEIKTLADWCRDSRCKSHYHAIKSRINNLKWDAEKAITTPTRPILNRIRKD